MNNSVIECLIGRGSTTPARGELTSLSVGTAESILTVGTDTASTFNNASLSIPMQGSIVGAGTLRNLNTNAASSYPFPSSQVNRRGMQLPPFNSDSFSSRALKIRLSGNYTTGTSTATATIKIYQNTSAVLASGNNLVGTAMVSTTHAATAGNFIVESIVLWDAVSLTMNPVESWGSFGGTYVARGTQSASAISLTAANFLKTVFVASVTFSANASGNLFNPIEFSLEEI